MVITCARQLVLNNGVGVSPYSDHVGFQAAEHGAYSLHLTLNKAVQQDGLGEMGRVWRWVG